MADKSRTDAEGRRRTADGWIMDTCNLQRFGGFLPDRRSSQKYEWIGWSFGVAEEINLVPRREEKGAANATAASSQEWKIEILTLPSLSLSLSLWRRMGIEEPACKPRQTQPRDLNARKARDYQGTYQSRFGRGDP